MFGTALLYGDGLITPAISVLSAVEGFEVATTAFEAWVIPVAVAILVVLFLVQRRGTERIARVFAPVMVVWFVVIGVLGLRQIIDAPRRAAAPSRRRTASSFFVDQPGKAFLALGSIFLVVTGGEALYADMGHFGRRPIQVSWYTLVLPALLLNYFGQAALLRPRPEAVGLPFFRLAPEWAVRRWRRAGDDGHGHRLAGADLGRLLAHGPGGAARLPAARRHPPHLAAHIGQIYVPLVNWLLMIGCVGLVIGFQTSSNLAAAYGIAVTTTMAITTLLFYRVVVDRWGWSRPKALAVVVPLLVVDLAFLAANIPKIPHGGWFPLLVGVVLVVQMTTWRRAGHRRPGRAAWQRRRRGRRSERARDGVARVPGTAVYMFKDPGRRRTAMISNLRHNHVLHETTVVLSVIASRRHVSIPADRLA